MFKSIAELASLVYATFCIAFTTAWWITVLTAPTFLGFRFIGANTFSLWFFGIYTVLAFGWLCKGLKSPEEKAEVA